MVKFFQAADGRRLAYVDDGGDGPAVLCLAGLTRNHRDFNELTKFLSPHYRVVRLDSRGRGASEHAADPLAEYTAAMEAHDAIQLMDHLDLRRLALIGTSRGGILSMAIAAARPERITAVVLNDVGAVVEGRGLLRIMATLGRQPTAETFAAAADDLRRTNAPAFLDVSNDEWLRHARCLYDDRGGRPSLAYDPKLRWAVAKAIDVGEPSIQLWPMFEALKSLPVLVIRGANSDVLSAETVSAMRAVHPNLEAVTIADRGHAPFLTEPPAKAAIAAFLASHIDANASPDQALLSKTPT